MGVTTTVAVAKQATKIQRFLGEDYTVLASYGHVRDLPARNGSVDPDNDFALKVRGDWGRKGVRGPGGWKGGEGDSRWHTCICVSDAIEHSQFPRMWERYGTTQNS
eukprot:354619-Chlamydomonas_euryale.AAC.5